MEKQIVVSADVQAYNNAQRALTAAAEAVTNAKRAQQKAKRALQAAALVLANKAAGITAPAPVAA